MSLQRKRSRARKRLQTADMSVFTSPPSSVWGTNKNKKTKKRREECDGHAFASLSRRPLWVWWSRLSWFVPNQSDCKEDRERELHIRRRVLTLQPETSVQTPHTSPPSLLPPVFLHTSAQSDLLSDLCAHRVSQHDFGQISFDRTDTAACRQRADVYHQHLVLGQFLNLQVRKTVRLLIPKSEKLTHLSSLSHKALLTLAAFLSPSVRTPSSLLSRK